MILSFEVFSNEVENACLFLDEFKNKFRLYYMFCTEDNITKIFCKINAHDEQIFKDTFKTQNKNLIIYTKYRYTAIDLEGVFDLRQILKNAEMVIKSVLSFHTLLFDNKKTIYIKTYFPEQYHNKLVNHIATALTCNYIVVTNLLQIKIEDNYVGKKYRNLFSTVLNISGKTILSASDFFDLGSGKQLVVNGNSFANGNLSVKTIFSDEGTPNGSLIFSPQSSVSSEINETPHKKKLLCKIAKILLNNFSVKSNKNENFSVKLDKNENFSVKPNFNEQIEHNLNAIIETYKNKVCELSDKNEMLNNEIQNNVIEMKNLIEQITTYEINLNNLKKRKYDDFILTSDKKTFSV